MSKEKSKKGNKGPVYNTGLAAIRIYSSLLRDFRRFEGEDFFAGADHDLMSDIKTFRRREPKEQGLVSVGRFKRTKQMESLLKKFRFQNDFYTDAELSEKTLNSFLEEQNRLQRPLPLRCTGNAVLKEARIIAKGILGEYPGDSVIENCRFGKKSSIGCPLVHAFIDEKLSMKEAFTGTSPSTEVFFNQVLPGDHVLSRILKHHDPGQLKEQLEMDYLNLVEVPKTWDKYRLITPLTLLGLFFSYGLGRVVQSLLADAGLDISLLQGVHRSLVQGYSVSLTHGTADLSSASDSITSELLNRVLPRPWYVALKKTFVRQLNVDGVKFSTASVLPMGNGATFPFETLVFYCIIKAIGKLTNTKGTYSVYGDDLIYPSRLHKYVVVIFPQLHLKLNRSKTFMSYPFRESCGSDFYRGQDVRPHFIRGDAEDLTRVKYEAFLYKVYNGLVARWDPLEIREALTWILSELSIVSHGILRVPPSFPDYSGVKVSRSDDIPLHYNLLPFAPVTYHPFEGSRWYCFDFLVETPQKRIVKMMEPYYWLSLQGLNDDVIEEEWKKSTHLLNDPKKLTPKYISESFLPINRVREAKKSSLRWQRTVMKLKPYYHKGRKVVRERTSYNAVVDSRNGSTVSTATTKTGSVSDWL